MHSNSDDPELHFGEQVYHELLIRVQGIQRENPNTDLISILMHAWQELTKRLFEDKTAEEMQGQLHALANLLHTNTALDNAKGEDSKTY